MRTIIAGGRDYDITPADLLELNKLSDEITEVVSGGAPGVDSAGEQWAQLHSKPVRRFPALWGLHGLRAGPVRNEQMAQYAAGGMAVLFPGGKGTKDMTERAKKWCSKVVIINLNKKLL